jgi:dsRNA-specific ribonuclease
MVFISHGEERMKGREKFSILSDSFEALIAGIYLDCGAEQSEKFVRKYVYNKIAGIDTTPVKSYKSLVQELIQRDYKVIPDYHDTEYEVSSSGNVETYKSEIFLHNTKKAEGFGLSKKKAQEAAAKNFFEEKKKSEA